MLTIRAMMVHAAGARAAYDPRWIVLALVLAVPAMHARANFSPSRRGHASKE
jgi:hypothetical protein